MKKQYAIPIVLGVSIVLLAISTSFFPLQQFASATVPALKKPANPAAGAPPMTRGLSDMTGGNMTGGNMTGGNMTRGLSGIPSANPAAGAPPATPTTPYP
jgi:hypothetical protein